MVYSDFEEGQYETNKSDDGTSVDFNLSNDEVRKRQLFQGGRNFESHIEEKIHDSCSTKNQMYLLQRCQDKKPDQCNRFQ